AYAYHNLWAGAYPTFNVNLTVSYPLQNHLANGLRGVASEEQRQADVQTAGVSERIGYEARNALQSYESALAKLSAARTSRESAEQVYASELRRFRNGLSTTFLVLQRQVELSQAEGQELQAQTELNKSVVEIQRVEGVVISQNRVNPNALGTQALTATSPQPK
ncbi:MAG TPA: TolC family protein, partial [Candidatus Acidoferrales bacterium]|nr:TolC family protein [Candidatus Acidoferrales bacterium]